jgi:mono/diheme cytochrome c family protein
VLHDDKVKALMRILAFTLALSTTVGIIADEASVDFARDVQPIFARHCYECHGPKHQEGGLRLDLRARALAGGDAGKVIAADSASSALIKRVTSSDRDERMPPEGERLTPDQIATLRRWIDGGANWPDAAAGEVPGSRHWSFQPIRRPQLPERASRRKPEESSHWNAIDAFVVARLEQEGIAPSPEANRSTLIRRLSLDLLGLLPSEEEVATFVADDHSLAYERLVDRMLASPRFGERWARHWLDLARYGDSHGYENDSARPNAYRYRDWVIEAINSDLPFDQFTIEQLAGDLLPQATPTQKIAAGFHRHTLTHNSSENAKEEYRVVAVKDRTDTTGVVWLGLTIGCAQCHSHKFDPITQREYYGLYSFFSNADERDEGEISTFAPASRTNYVHLRGDFQRPGAQVTPHTPSFLPPLSSRSEMPDRLDLARWLIDERNPLMARVAVNHAWQHLFGEGLVATPEDFGAKGEPPSHPELLDWLASEFRRDGWSRKELLREIVTSQTYRRSSFMRDDLATKDPRNVLLARQNRFRVEAEIVRDLALQASGLLNGKLGGSSIQPPLPAGVAKLPISNERLMGVTAGPDRYRRGLYINAQRTYPHPLLATFDGNDSNQTCPRRDRSTTPLQALALLNDPTFVECAQSLGRSLAVAKVDDNNRLQRLFTACLSRQPTDTELSVLREQLVRQRGHSKDEAVVWSGLATVVLNLEEFITRE